MRWVALVALIVLAAGCAGGPAAPAKRAYPKDAVELDVTAFPLSEDQLLFRTSTYNGLLENITPATLKVTLDYRSPARGLPSARVDSNQTTLDLGARRIAHADLQTKFLGAGDYFWNVTLVDGEGALVANQSGFYETCSC